MAISDTQKVDYLWKKIGYGISKTDTDVGKKAYEETIASPLLLRGDIIWQKSIDIPGTLPTANTSIITVYKDGSGSWSSTVECTEDATSTDNKSWKTNLTNWIGVEFGATYQVQVYIATAGVNNPQTSGTKIFAAGSGNNDEWFFDYQSGVLHFIGTTLPTAIATGITGKSIYVSGARYTGPIGFNISSSDSSNTQVLYNDNGNFAGSSSFTFNNTTNTITANNFVASRTANLGAVGNITITGGTSGQYLKTDGSGVVSWATVDSYRISNGTTQVYTYNNGNVAISAGGNSNVLVITGDGISVTGALSASSVTGTFTGSIGNGTSNITFPTVNGNINLISGGNTTLLLTPTGANITGYANITGNLNAANITRDNKNVITFVSASTKPSNPSLGDSWYNTTTDKTYQYIYDGSTYNWVDISSGFMLASILANASSLVYRDANANIYANNFSGNTITIAGTGVSNIGNVGNLRITGGTSGYVLRTDGAGNLSWISPSSAAGGSDTQILFNDGGSANGNSSLTFSKITGLLTTGNLTTNNDVIIGGNLTVSGTTEYFNVTSTVIKDPIIELGGGTNAAALTTNDSKDRGTLLHYYTTKVVDAFMGWDNSNAEFAFGSNVSVSGEVVTFNTLGNVRAGYFIGNGSLLTGLPESYANANVASYLPTYTGNVSANYFIGNGSQLTSITGANVSGNVTGAVQAHYANIANSVTGANVSGNVTGAVQAHYANIANSVAGSNVSGQVGNALVAGTVYTGAQPNITSVGTLSSLTVTANVSAGNVLTDNLYYSNGAAWDLQQAAGSNTQLQFNNNDNFGSSANLTFNSSTNLLTVVGNIQSNNANLGNLTTSNYFHGVFDNTSNSQPNITSLGTLSSLTVSGTSQLGSLGSVKITGGLPNYVLKTDGTGNLSWVQVDTNPAFTGASYVSVAKDIFTASNATTISYTLSMTPSSKSAIVVNIDGLVQLSDTYSLSGAVLTFGEYLKQDSQVEVTMYGIVSIAGSNTQVQYNNSGAFDSSANFTFNSATNTLSANKVNVTEGPLTINGSTISVTSGVSAGIFNVGTPNISMGALSGNVTIGSSTGNVTLKGTVNISELSSNRASIAVTTDTLIDSFLVTKYRTAKYLISAESSAGYESVEVLLIHDGTNSYITTYGAISSVGYDDMITLTSNINGGNVCLYASNVYSSTNVNLLSTYVKI